MHLSVEIMAELLDCLFKTKGLSQNKVLKNHDSYEYLNSVCRESEHWGEA